MRAPFGVWPAALGAKSSRRSGEEYLWNTLPPPHKQLCGYDELRQRIGRQLNKGEQLHALRRAIFYANEGHVRQRNPDQQAEQALCLSIVCNAIIAWNTVYIQRVLDELLAAGELVTTSEIERISPLAHQHIHLYGHYPFDLATRPNDHRPLRVPATPPTPAPKTLNRV